MIKIIYADNSGGVKNASDNLHFIFIKNKINSKLLNIKSSDGIYRKFLLVIKEAIKFKKDDVFILQHFDAIFFGIFLNIFGFKNKINVFHTDIVSYYKNIGFIKKIIIKSILFIIKDELKVFVSKEAEINANKFFKLSKTNVIYNIFPIDGNKLKNYIFTESRNKIILGSISRLDIYKNIDVLIRVVRKCYEAGHNIELLIYGDGDQAKNLEKYLISQSCEKFIKLMGASENKNEMYSSIDAMISFSSIEGFGLSILESIGHNKPVLYTDCSSGPRELMAPNSNLLKKTDFFEKTDVGYLVKPMINLNSYSKALSLFEKDYVDIVGNFIKDVRGNRFSMNYDFSPFSEKIIIENWINLIDDIH